MQTSGPLALQLKIHQGLYSLPFFYWVKNPPIKGLFLGSGEGVVVVWAVHHVGSWSPDHGANHVPCRGSMES